MDDTIENITFLYEEIEQWILDCMSDHNKYQQRQQEDFMLITFDRLKLLP